MVRPKWQTTYCRVGHTIQIELIISITHIPFYLCLYRKDRRYVSAEWQSVRVGDTVHLSCNEVIPADLLLLGSEVLEGETITIFEVTGWHAGEALPVGLDYEAVLEQLGYAISNRSETSDKLFFNVITALRG